MPSAVVATLTLMTGPLDPLMVPYGRAAKVVGQDLPRAVGSPPSSRPEERTRTSGAQDVVVTAKKRSDDPEPRDVIAGSSRTFGLDNSESPVNLRFTFSYARDVAKCAMNDGDDRLRAVVDGAPNSATQVYAQDWTVRNNITCSVSANLLTISPPELGRSLYQRAAIIAEVINKYAPDLTITRKQTADPATIARFEAMEGPRNRFRQLADQKYFRVVVCMVQLQPEQALTLVQGRLKEAELSAVRARIISRGKVCAGNPRRIFVEATQFRSYVIDAVYRWALATRAVDSLIPG